MSRLCLGRALAFLTLEPGQEVLGGLGRWGGGWAGRRHVLQAVCWKNLPGGLSRLFLLIEGILIRSALEQNLKTGPGRGLSG